MNTALIVAAGAGIRSNLKTSKILYEINEKPLFMYSVELFQSLGYEICLVVSKADLNKVMDYVKPPVQVVTGGKTRGQSVLNGLKSITTPYVFIHDAARPFLSKPSVLALEKALEQHDAVFLAEPITSALKHVSKNDVTSIDRSQHLLAQTPQAFLTEKIRRAYLRADMFYDDDISLYQAIYEDADVEAIINQDINPKLTYHHDFIHYKKLMEGNLHMKVGHSYDIHALKQGRPLILGGIQIEHDKGLDGHSDADVCLHVIAEAMMGALGIGDLGTHFPDTDLKIEGISSQKIIQFVDDKMHAMDYEINNIDVTIYAEEPQLKSYIPLMRAKIAEMLNIALLQLNIKASTHEKMDAVGKKQAIAAEAVVLIKQVIQ